MERFEMYNWRYHASRTIIGWNTAPELLLKAREHGNMECLGCYCPKGYYIILRSTMQEYLRFSSKQVAVTSWRANTRLTNSHRGDITWPRFKNKDGEKTWFSWGSIRTGCGVWASRFSCACCAFVNLSPNYIGKLVLYLHDTFNEGLLTRQLFEPQRLSQAAAHSIP